MGQAEIRHSSFKGRDVEADSINWSLSQNLFDVGVMSLQLQMCL